jgi:hypothetical protein
MILSFVNVEHHSVFESMICADIGSLMSDFPIFQSKILLVTE